MSGIYCTALRAANAETCMKFFYYKIIIINTVIIIIIL